MMAARGAFVSLRRMKWVCPEIILTRRFDYAAFILGTQRRRDLYPFLGSGGHAPRQTWPAAGECPPAKRRQRERALTQPAGPARAGRAAHRQPAEQLDG